MKKLLLLFFILIQCTLLFGQKPPLGIGFVYDTKSYEYHGRMMPKVYDNREMTVESKNVEAYFYKPDYGLLHFSCIRITDSYYEIYIGENKKGYIPINDQFEFIELSEMLKNCSVKRISPNNNPILNEPDGNSKIRYSCSREYLNVKEIKSIGNENWMNIYFSKDCDPMVTEEMDVTYGWIKWKNNSQLLVQIFPY
ncbi:hypothetical protein [Flammeovirga sp. SJP92]|uniref:hypothetical protein n=1 Tax=Flammeovirga sp. SJP92 TaxID=1775430 RepID=UPI000797C197|nr:hypothetical protein [Flammeovirga sp. SJP92]KXX69114.1 hypothetical protein AVL50_16890 [Flammeovirga sp. SJP92]